jgi:tetratricopeptide (TPR) repeat protein
VSFFDRLAEKLGLRSVGGGNTPSATGHETLQTLLERMKRYKRSGDYDKALQEIERATQMISGYEQSLVNESLPFALRLHTADIYTQQKRYVDAQNLLLQLQNEAESHKQKAYLAYVLMALGSLSQDQAQWELARDYYERALRVGKEYKLVGAEGRAQGHLADTYLNEGNASFATYLLQEAIPKINTSGDMELSSYFVGRLGESLIIQGKKSEGQNLIGRALRIAEQMEYRQYQIRWRNVLAVEAMGEGLYDEARRLLTNVLTQLSTQSPKDGAKVVLVLCRLVKVCLRLNDISAALDYSQQATEFTDGLSDADKLLLEATLGVVARTVHDYDATIAHLNTAIDGGYANHTWTEGEHSPVEIFRNLAVAYTEKGDYVSARTTFDSALAHAEKRDDPLDNAAIHRDIGIFYMRQSQLDEALKEWQIALRLYEGRGQYARVARLYCDIAHFRKQSGQFKRAMADYQMALQTLSSVDDTETRGVVLANTAIAFVDYGDMETVDAFFTESIQIAGQLADRLAESTRRGNYGWFLLITGKPDRALDMLEYALRLSEQLGVKMQLAVQTDNIGLVYDEKGNYERAVYYHAKAWELLVGSDDNHWRGIVSANLGNSLVSLGKLVEAQKLLDVALESGRQNDDTEVIARALMGMVRLRLAEPESNTNDLITWLDEAQTRAEATHSRRLMGDVYALRSRVEAHLGDMPKAREAWDRAVSMFKLLSLPTADNIPAWLAGE